MRIDSTEALGLAIRERRLELGLSQEALADVVGVNRRVVGELERGKRSVQLNLVMRIAQGLGLDLELRERGR
jgi:y4mF family transcriptional regulator